MTAVTEPLYITPEAYLAAEARAERRSEYRDGQIVAMAGASPNHNRINRNVVKRLLALLNGTPCEPYWNETRVHVAVCDAYFYPDALIVCGEAEVELTETETLSNPSVVFEVVSPSTEAADRGRKFACYRALPPLRHYVLIVQDAPAIDLYTRQAEGTWQLYVLTGMEAVLRLDTPALALPFTEIYQGIEFPAALTVMAEASPSPAAAENISYE